MLPTPGKPQRAAVPRGAQQQLLSLGKCHINPFLLESLSDFFTFEDVSGATKHVGRPGVLPGALRRLRFTAMLRFKRSEEEAVGSGWGQKPPQGAVPTGPASLADRTPPLCSTPARRCISAAKHKGF